MNKVRIASERTHYFSPSINVVMSAEIEGILTVEALQTAIYNATSRHEILTSKILQDNKGNCFYVPDKTPKISIQIIQDVNQADLQIIINEQERIPFDFENGELLRFFIAIKEQSIKLILVAHHLAGDGMAMIYLLRDVMDELAGINHNKDICPITLFDTKMIPKERKLNFLIRFGTKMINKQWNKAKHIFTYDEYQKMFNRFWENRRSNVLTCQLNVEQLKKIVEVSKANKITVNSLLITAFIKAYSESRVGMAINVRPKGYEGMGNYATATSIKHIYQPNQTFEENAKTVHKLIHTKLRNRKWFLSIFLESFEHTLIDATYFNAFSDFSNKTAEKISKLFGYHSPINEIGTSNLGRISIPESYGDFKLKKLMFVPPIIPNTERVLGIVTLGDTMTITMHNFDNENSQKEEEMFLAAMDTLKL